MAESGIKMYRGINAVTIDVKGRFAIPSRIRSTLQEKTRGSLVATIDTEERCLLIYPLLEWEMIENKIAALPTFNPITRRIQRLLIGHASELELDAHGRILLPPLLRQHAQLEKSAVLVGQGKKFELWNESCWQTARDIWLQETGGHTGALPSELEAISL